MLSSGAFLDGMENKAFNFSPIQDSSPSRSKSHVPLHVNITIRCMRLASGATEFSDEFSHRFLWVRLEHLRFEQLSSEESLAQASSTHVFHVNVNINRNIFCYVELSL